MTSAPKDFARPRKPQDIYWTTPSASSLAEIHPLLMAVLLMRANRAQLLIQSCQVFDAATASPRGNFDVAFDPSTGSAWGYFDHGNTDHQMTRPLAFQLSGPSEDSIEAFHRVLQERGE
ncbi:hypothetical protein QTL95_01585 [Rhizobium sp. S152]|uniref:hypothetical protein n=1 Tax=Rhizobium sp. S152 TaxID=3055038 RepID=UPI0025A9471C|nr:hypothetical protein [Rhizobium sp. S152]MDM9624568.1 hypothetical protein [Rhizobium sp. S152]